MKHRPISLEEIQSTIHGVKKCKLKLDGSSSLTGETLSSVRMSCESEFKAGYMCVTLTVSYAVCSNL